MMTFMIFLCFTSFILERCLQVFSWTSPRQKKNYTASRVWSTSTSKGRRGHWKMPLRLTQPCYPRLLSNTQASWLLNYKQQTGLTPSYPIPISCWLNLNSDTRSLRWIRNTQSGLRNRCWRSIEHVFWGKPYYTIFRGELYSKNTPSTKQLDKSKALMLGLVQWPTTHSVSIWEVLHNWKACPWGLCLPPSPFWHQLMTGYERQAVRQRNGSDWKDVPLRFSSPSPQALFRHLWGPNWWTPYG